MRLKDKRALITGAAGDIGRATALRFADEGAPVIISDIDEGGLRETLREIEIRKGRVKAIPADLTCEDQIVGMFEQIRQAFGRLDILVNVAGGDYEPMTGFDDISVEGVDRNLSINLRSCMLCCREAAKLMMQQEDGKIINMCSVMYRGAPTPMQHSYAAAKGGIFAFTRSLAMNLGLYNINVNAVAPSLIEVAALKKGMGEMWEAVKQDCESRYPLGRIGQPADIANCILFLASEESAFITGQVIEVSGGARL